MIAGLARSDRRGRAWLAGALLAGLALGAQDEDGSAAQEEALLRAALRRSPHSDAVFERWQRLWIEGEGSKAWLEVAREEARREDAAGTWIAWRVYTALDQHEEARQSLRRLQASSPRDAAVWIASARHHHSQGEPTAARAAWEYAGECAPRLDQRREIARALATLLVRDGEREAAQRSLRDALAHDEADLHLREEMAELASELALDELAEELWTDLRRRAEDAGLRSRATLALADRWSRRGRHDELRATLWQSLESIDSRDWRAGEMRQRLEASYLDRGEAEVWLAALAEAAGRHAGDVGWTLAWIEAADRLASREDAARGLQQALQRFPESSALRERAIQQAQTRGEPDAAYHHAHDLARLVDSAGRWEQAAQLALVRAEEAELREAGLQHLRRALTLDPSAEAAGRAADQVLAAARRQLRRLHSEAAALLMPAADEFLDEALRRAPEDPAPIERRVQHHLELSQLDEARSQARRLLAGPAPDAALLLRFGRLAEALDDPVEARRALEQAAQLAPGVETLTTLIEFLLRQRAFLEASRRVAELSRRPAAADQGEVVVSLALDTFRGAGRLDERARELSRRTEAGEATALECWELARIERDRQRPDEAVPAFERALRDRPEDARLRDELVAALAESREPERAPQRLRRWAEQSPSRRLHYQARAIRLDIAQGRLSLAIREARRLVRSDPDSAQAHEVQAEACFAAGADDEGLRALRRAHHRAPDDHGLRDRLITQLLRQAPREPTLWPEADRHCFDALLEATDAAGRERRTQQLMEIAGRRGRAGELADRLRDHRDRVGSSPELVAMIARVELAEGRIDAAKQDLDRALRRDPDSLALLRPRIELARQLRQWTLAAELQERLLRLDPSARGWCELAELYAHAGRTADQQRVWAKLLEAPGGVEVAAQRIVDWMRDGELTAARAAAQRSAELAPRSWRLRHLSGLVAIAAGERDEASRSFLQLAVEGRPGGPGPATPPLRLADPAPLAAPLVAHLDSQPEIEGTAIFSEQTQTPAASGSRVRLIHGSSLRRAPSSYLSPEGPRPLGGRLPWPPLQALDPNRGMQDPVGQLEPRRKESSEDFLRRLAELPLPATLEEARAVAALIAVGDALTPAVQQEFAELCRRHAQDPVALTALARAALHHEAWPIVREACPVLEADERTRRLGQGLRLRCLDAAEWPDPSAAERDAVVAAVQELSALAPDHAEGLRRAVCGRAVALSWPELLRAVVSASLDRDSWSDLVQALWWTPQVDDPDWAPALVARLEELWLPKGFPGDAALLAHQLWMHGGVEGRRLARRVFLRGLDHVADDPTLSSFTCYRNHRTLIAAEFRDPLPRPELPATSLLFLHEMARSDEADAFLGALPRSVAGHRARAALHWFGGRPHESLRVLEEALSEHGSDARLALDLARGALRQGDTSRAARALRQLDPDGALRDEILPMLGELRTALFVGSAEQVAEAVALELQLGESEPDLDALFPHWGDMPESPPARRGAETSASRSPREVARELSASPRFQEVAATVRRRAGELPGHHDLRVLDLLWRGPDEDLEPDAAAWLDAWRQQRSGYGSPVYVQLAERLLQQDPASPCGIELVAELAQPAARHSFFGSLRRLFQARGTAAASRGLAVEDLVQQFWELLARSPERATTPGPWGEHRRASLLLDWASSSPEPARRELVPACLRRVVQSHRQLRVWTDPAGDAARIVEAAWHTLPVDARDEALHSLHALIFIRGRDQAPPHPDDRLATAGAFEAFVDRTLGLALGHGRLAEWSRRWESHRQRAHPRMLWLRASAERRLGRPTRTSELERRQQGAEAWRASYDEGMAAWTRGRPEARIALEIARGLATESEDRARIDLALGSLALHEGAIDAGLERLDSAVRAEPGLSAETAWAILSSPAWARIQEVGLRHLQWAQENEAHRPRTARAQALASWQARSVARAHETLQALDEVRIVGEQPLHERFLRAIVQHDRGLRREARRALDQLEALGRELDDPRWRELRTALRNRTKTG